LDREADDKAGRQLQLFNLGTKQKVGAHLMNDDIPFWTWVNDTTLGIVTDREVFHWKVMEGQTAPQKVASSCLLQIWAKANIRYLIDMPTSMETRSSTTKSRLMDNGLF